MNIKEKEEISKELKAIKRLNIEEIIDMSKYTINTYITTMMSFGINSKASKEVMKIYKQFINDIEKENKIMTFLNTNLDVIDYNEIDEYLDNLYDLNYETMKYYYESLDIIEDACEMEEERRITPNKKEFKTMSESENELDAIGLTLNENNVKEYLNYEEDFWDYVKKRVKKIPNSEEAMSFYGVFLKEEQGCLKDINIVCVPYVNNLLTTLVNIHEYKHAHDIYEKLNNDEVIDTEKYEKDAKNEERQFKYTYLKKKWSDK